LTLKDVDLLADGSGLPSCRVGGLVVQVGEGTEADDGVAGALLLCGVKEILRVVDVGVLLSDGVGQVGERSGGLRGLPTDVVKAGDAKADRKLILMLLFSGAFLFFSMYLSTATSC